MKKDKQRFDEILCSPVEILGLTHISDSVLNSHGFYRVCDLVEYTELELLDISDFSYECVKEISKKLYLNGLSLGMELDDDNPNDIVKDPIHYKVIDYVDAIEIIASSMTREMFKGYCLGNILKYRLRAGKKGDAQIDLDKATEYNNIYHRYITMTKDYE